MEEVPFLRYVTEVKLGYDAGRWKAGLYHWEQLVGSGMPAHAILLLFKYILTLDPVAPFLTLHLLTVTSEKIPSFLSIL